MPHTSLRPLYDLVRLNSYLMMETIEQFDEDKAKERVLGGSRNSFKFVLGHIVWSRCRIADLLGESQSFPWLGKFAGGQSHSDGSDYPALSELAAAYEDVALALEEAFEGLSEDEFMSRTDNVPGEQENTVRGAISFWVWQDSYHMGQVGSILTTLGLTDLKTLHYERRDRLHTT